MADEQKKSSDAGVVSRLAGRGEDAITRLMDELGRNSRVTDALARAMSAKGKVDETTRKTLGQIGLAAADEIKDVRTRLEQLEKRISALETSTAPTSRRKTGAARRTGAPPGGTKTSGPTASTKRRSGTSPTGGTTTSGTTRTRKPPPGASPTSGSSPAGSS